MEQVYPRRRKCDAPHTAIERMGKRVVPQEHERLVFIDLSLDLAEIYSTFLAVEFTRLQLEKFVHTRAGVPDMVPTKFILVSVKKVSPVVWVKGEPVCAYKGLEIMIDEFRGKRGIFDGTVGGRI